MIEDVEQDARANVGATPQDSLAARMEARAEELSQERTEWFPIPGWDDLLEVQLRSIGFRTIKKAVTRNRSVREEDTRDLYAMADNLVAATVGFRQLRPERKDLPDETWKSLGQRLQPEAQNLSQRQGLLLMLGEDRILFLLEEYTEWARDTRHDIDEEAVQDFTKTG